MPGDVGTQTVTLKFYDPRNTTNINRRQKDVVPTGIYKGGYLTRKNDSEVYLSPLICEIQDSGLTTDNVQIRTETADTVTVTGVASATPYIVLRWTYTGVAADDYVDFQAVATPDTYDLVVGKAAYVGAVMQTTFNYIERSNPSVKDLFLKVEPEQTPSMYVRIRAGVVQIGSNKVVISDQLSSVFTAPGSGSKTGVVYIDDTGAVQVSSDFTYAGQLVLAEIALTSGQTQIVASNITDIRSFLTCPLLPDDSSLTRNSTSGKLEIKTSGVTHVKLGNVYDSGWFSVTKSTTYTKTHNLGSPHLLLSLLFAPSSGGNPDLTKVTQVESDMLGGKGELEVGASIQDITNTQLSIVTGNENVAYRTGASGLTTLYVSGYYKVLAMRIT